MKLHLRPIPALRRVKADTAAYKAAQQRVLESLRAVKRESDLSKEERRISAELVEKRNRHMRDSQQFRQQGETHQ